MARYADAVKPIRWNTKAMRALKAHPRVDECENEGMDPDRFFVHLKGGWKWADMEQMTDVNMIEHTRSFGGAVEAMAEVKQAIPCDCEGCRHKKGHA